MTNTALGPARTWLDQALEELRRRDACGPPVAPGRQVVLLPPRLVRAMRAWGWIDAAGEWTPQGVREAAAALSRWAHRHL
jgi:hypothetical protein